MRFQNYMRDAGNIFLEMPRVKDDEKVYFPEALDDFLKNFMVKDENGVETDKFGKIDPNLSSRWVAKALDWLFSVGLHKNISTMDDVALTTTGADGKNTTRVFKGVHVPLEALHQAFDQDYDIAKLKPATHSTAKVWGKKFIDYATGQGDRPSFAFSKARKNFSSPAVHQYTYRVPGAGDPHEEEPQDATLPGMSDPDTDEVDAKGLSLDADDLQFLNYFKHNPELRKYAVTAFRKRYSPHLIEDPQARQSNYGGEPGQYFDMEFTEPMTGRKVAAPKVPVNANRLRKRLKRMYDKYGIPFITRGIPKQSAVNWIQHPEGKYNITYHQKKKDRVLNTADFSGSHEEENERQHNLAWYRGAWKKFVDGHGDIPTDPDSSSRIDSEDLGSWDELLQKEAEHAASKALSWWRSKLPEPVYRSLKDNESDNLANVGLSFLMNDKTVKNPEYMDQKWRLNAAQKIARQEIEDVMDRDRGGKEDSEVLHGLAKDREKALDGRNSDEDPDTDDTQRSILADLVRKLIRDYDIDLLPTISIDDIADEAEDMIAKGGKDMGYVGQYAILRDLLQKYSKSVQARPTSFSAKAAAEKMHTGRAKTAGTEDDGPAYTVGNSDAPVGTGKPKSFRDFLAARKKPVEPMAPPAAAIEPPKPEPVHHHREPAAPIPLRPRKTKSRRDDGPSLF